LAVVHRETLTVRGVSGTVAWSGPIIGRAFPGPTPVRGLINVASRAAKKGFLEKDQQKRTVAV
jgi:hypothetical protein